MFLVVSQYPSESLELGRDIPGTALAFVAAEMDGDWLRFFVATDYEPGIEGCFYPGCEGAGRIPDPEDEPGSWTTCPACKGSGADPNWPV